MGADVVVAVDISRRPAKDANDADVVIRPQTTRSRINDFQHRQANIAAGEAAANEVIQEIRARLAAAGARKVNGNTAAMLSR
jgi:predicted acylesterase/phospholipase RssA